MPKKDEQLSLVERALRLAKRYTLGQILKAVLLVLAIGWAVTLSTWIYTSGRHIADRYAEITLQQLDERNQDKAEAHSRAIAYRRDITGEMKALMTETLTATGASRCFVIELHNGTNNLQGLPFYYGEMTYEVTDGVADYVAEEYNQITLSRYDWPSYVRKVKMWQGTPEELEAIDLKMGRRIMAHEVTYFALIHISGAHGDLGYFGLDFCSDMAPDSHQVTRSMYDAAQKLASILDNGGNPRQ